MWFHKGTVRPWGAMCSTEWLVLVFLILPTVTFIFYYYWQHHYNCHCCSLHLCRTFPSCTNSLNIDTPHHLFRHCLFLMNVVNIVILLMFFSYTRQLLHFCQSWGRDLSHVALWGFLQGGFPVNVCGWVVILHSCWESKAEGVAPSQALWGKLCSIQVDEWIVSLSVPLCPCRLPVRHLSHPELLRQDGDGSVPRQNRPQFAFGAGRLHICQGKNIRKCITH